MAIEKIINLISKLDDTGIEQAEQGIKKVDEASANLENQNKNTAKSTNRISTAVKGIGVALKAAGIGIAIALFAKLADMFTKNQKVVDLFSNVTTTLSIAFNDLFSIFDDGLPSLDELGKSIKDNILERFKSALEVSGLLGKALNKLRKGDFSGAFDAVKEAGQEALDVLTGVDDSLEKISTYTSEIYEQAEAFTELTNQSRLAEAQLGRVFEQADRNAEIQRRIRDDFNLSGKERLDASEKLKDILDEQEKVQLRLAGLSVQRAQQNIELNGKNIDNQIELINALKEQDAIQADIAGRRAEQEAQDRALRKEILEERKLEALDLGGLGSGSSVETNPEVLLAQSVADAIVNIEKNKGNELKALEQDVANAKVDTALNTLALIGQIADEGSALAKGVQVAQTVISGIQGVQSAFTTASASPITTLFPAYPFIQAGLAGAFSALQVKKILSTDASGRTAPNVSAGGGGGGGASAPSFNVVGNSGVSQIGQTLNQEQEPVQAFVVGNAVTSQQALDRDIVDTATLG